MSSGFSASGYTPDAHVSVSEAAPIGVEMMALPCGSGFALMNDAHQFLGGTRVIDGGPSQGGREIIVINVIREVMSGTFMGLSYQVSVDEARAIAEALNSLADGVEAGAKAASDALFAKVKKGGAS